MSDILDEDGIVKKISRRLMVWYYYLLRVLPIRQNKVVVNSYDGKKYGDNCKYILEELHRIYPEAEIVWLKDMSCDFEVPSYMRVVDIYAPSRRIREMATAKIWITSSYYTIYDRKRKGQFVIQTWHGGLGIKKVGDYKGTAKSFGKMLENQARITDLAISNSDHLNRVYREAFGYKGEIWKVGYPKNDPLLADHSEERKRVREGLGLQTDTRIFLYAPTFREHAIRKEEKLFDLDYGALRKALETRFGGEWKIVVKWHPLTAGELPDLPSEVMDVTDFPDMQELIAASDAYLSDFSSGIFDGALIGMPCFLYARDFMDYAKERGVYYMPEELPFPFSETGEELVQAVLSYDEADARNKWQIFTEKTGYYESGHAARDIAERMMQIMKGRTRRSSFDETATGRYYE